MGIYFRDILIKRISRGTNNCGHCVLEKNIYFLMWSSSTFTLLQLKVRLFWMKAEMDKQCRLIFKAFFDHITKGMNNFDHTHTYIHTHMRTHTKYLTQDSTK